MLHLQYQPEVRAHIRYAPGATPGREAPRPPGGGVMP